MKPIATAALDGGIKWSLEIVLAKNPSDPTPGFDKPVLLAGEAVCLKTCGDGGASLNRLLIKTGLFAILCAESPRTDGHEDILVVSMLLGNKPLECLTPDVDHPLVLTSPTREHQRPRQPGIRVGEALLKPLPRLRVTAFIDVQ